MKNLVCLLTLFLVLNANAQEEKDYISVTGTSEITIPADQIEFNVQIRTISHSIAASKEDNDKALKELLNILNETGINKEDIEVSPVTLGKNYEYDNGKRELRGFFTNVTVSFKLKDFTKYFSLSDKLSQNNNFEVTGSYYSLSDYERHHKEAYIKAAEAAREKAEYLAAALKIAVGAVIAVEEGEYSRPVMMMNKMEFSDASTGAGEMIQGNVKISRTLRVKFGIKN